MNKKLTKLLSVFIIAGAIGTGSAFGLAGCGHKHSAASEWQSDETNHWHDCADNDGEKLDVGAHEYDNDSDASCNVCGYERQVTIAVTGVSLDQTEVTLKMGATVTATLVATVSPSNASNKQVSWSSSDETVATVENGVVTAVAAGNATITVTTADGSRTATCAVTVQAADVTPEPETPTITGVTASASKTEATVNDTITLTATVSGTGEYNQNVTWAITEGSDKATLEGNTLTVTGAGTVKVQATAVGDETKKSEEITITVTAASVTPDPEPTPETYTVTWKNGETELEKDTNVAKDATPSYDGATPTKAATAQYTYTFNGWTDGTNTYGLTDELPAVTGDVTYTAVFAETVNKYTVTWKNGEETLATAQVEYGTVPTFTGATPTKQGDAQYSYTFAGWNEEVVAVTGEATYTAKFTETVNKYTVTWKNYDGTVLETDAEVPYGTVPTYDRENPTKVEDGKNFAFSGWDKEVVAVTGDVEYTAQFTELQSGQYSVTFNMNGHGAAIADGVTTDGKITAPTAPTADGYTFGGWFETAACDGTAIDFATKEFTANTTVYAKWTIIEYTIEYMVDGELHETKKYTIETIDNYVHPDVPEKTGYTGEWKVSDLHELGNKIFTAEYTPIEYTITYNLDGGTNAQDPATTYTIESEDITLAAPTKDGYRFDGWYNGDTKVVTIAKGSTGDITLTAAWVEQVTLTVTDKSGATVGSSAFDKGATVTQEELDELTTAPAGYAVWKVYSDFNAGTEYTLGEITADTTLVATFVLTEDSYIAALDATIALKNVTVTILGEKPTTGFAADGERTFFTFSDPEYRDYSAADGYVEYVQVNGEYYKRTVASTVEGYISYDDYVSTVLDAMLGRFKSEYEKGTYDDKNDEYVKNIENVGEFKLTISDGKVTTMADSRFKVTITEGSDTITLPEAEEYNQYAELAQNMNNVVAQTFNKITELPVFGGTYGNKGVYVKDSNYTISEGVLDVGNTTANTSAIVDFGIVRDVIEGYFEFKFLGTLPKSGNGNSVNFYNGSSKVLTIMGHSSGAAYTIENIPGVETQPTTTIKCDNTTLIKVYFKFDITNKTVSLVLNGEVVCTDLACDIDNVSGFEIITSNSGQRHCVLDNVAVNANISYSLDDYKAMLSDDLQALRDGMSSTHTINAEKVDAAFAEGTQAIDETNDYVSAKNAYDNAVKALNAIADDYQQEAINYVETQYPAANYTQNKTAYDAKIALIKKESDPAKLTLPVADPETPAGETLAAVLTAIAAIDNDEACYNTYAAEQIATLKANYPASSYKINATAYNAIVDALAAPAYATSYEDSVAALATYLTEQENALNAIDNDATVISDTIETKVNDKENGLVNYKSTEIAALETSKPEAFTYVSGEKTNIINAITAESIMADENYAANYEALINTAIASAKTAIDGVYASATNSLEGAIAEANTEYNDYVTAEIAKVEVNDSTFAAALTADGTKPAADFSSCKTSAAVLTALDAAKGNFDTWLSGKLAAKKYTITVHYGVRSTTVEVAYGAKLTEVADPTNDEGSPVYMLADDKIYSNAECTTEYTSTEVYADGDVYLKVVEAIVMSQNEAFKWSDISDVNDKEKIKQTDFTGANAFLTIATENSVEYRTGTDGGTSNLKVNYIQIDGEALQVEFNGAGTLKIKVRGTGSSATTALSLKNKDTGKCVSATYKKPESTDTVITEYDGNVYAIKTKDHYEITFNVATAGKYIICTNSTVTKDGAAVEGTFGLARLSVIELKSSYKAEKVDAESIAIDGNTSIEVGENSETTLTATVKPDDANYKEITWSINSVVRGEDTITAAEKIANIATIGSDGVLTLKAGAAVGDEIIVTATVDGKSDTHTVTVMPIRVETVEVSVKDGAVAKVEEEGTLQLVATITPVNATDKSVKWSSSAESIATVNADGVVTGVAAGKVTITATSNSDNSKYAEIEITVVAPIPVGSVVIKNGETIVSGTETPVEITDGDELQLTAVVDPENAIVTWKVTAGKDYISIDSTGKITAKAVTGESYAEVTASAGGKSATVKIKVNKRAVRTATLTIPAGTCSTSNTINMTDSESLLTIKSTGNYKDQTVDETSVGEIKTTNALLAQSNSIGASLTAGEHDITVQLYVAASDSKLNPKSVTISWTEDGGASKSYKTNQSLTAQIITINIKKGATIDLAVSGSRLIIFGAVISTVQ